MGKFEELKKALLTTTGGGDGLLPYDLDQALHEELLRLQPLAQLVQIIGAEGKTHEYRVRTAHPQGWFEGETTPMAQLSGTYERKTVQLKIQRIWGGVTGFAQAVDEAFIDALAEEIVGSLQGMADLMEYGALYGCADDLAAFTGDAYQYTGILPRVYADASANVLDAGSDKITLDDLDQALAICGNYRQLRFDDKLWLMSIRMKQVVEGLQAKVQLPLKSVELADGKIIMAAYGDAPILETNYMVPGTTSPACTAIVATGGTIPDGTYNYRLASVTMYGECVAGTASANVVCGTGDNKANLTWTADANAKLYMVFRRLASGDYYLIDIIAAKTYDGAGTVSGSVEAYTDDGSQSEVTQVVALETGEEMILLLNLNPTRGTAFIGLVDDMGRQVDRLLSFVELARVKDTYDYMIKGYMAQRTVHPNVHAVIRNVKLA